MYDKSLLVQLVRDRALKFGDFVLASGKKASYYLDAKQVVLSSQGARLVGEGILELLGTDLPSCVGGMSIGADPIVGAVITIAGTRGVSLNGFMVRKEPKGHGTNRFIEGPVQKGESAVIVEDVVTTGGSSLMAIERAVEYGLKIQQVIAIIDRMEGGAAAFAAKGYRLESLLTIQDFGISPPSS